MIVVWLWVLYQMNAPWWVVAVLITAYALRILRKVLKFAAECGDNE